MAEEDFNAALQECAFTARRAFQRTLLYYDIVSGILKKLEKDLDHQISPILADQDAKSFEFADVLKGIVVQIENQVEEGLVELLKSLKESSQHLEDFTVVLFGRTRAGKSTIREALTRGNGSTIGNGSQRTTRDVREYSWRGLRLIDTPGIEAYKGEEDRHKALEIIYQADIVVFLTSDDAIQPGEFRDMALLRNINKYFFVIINIKESIENPKRLERFIKNPSKVFTFERLKEHQNHIRHEVKENLQIDDLSIVCIHALAAFLSTQPEYASYSAQLWESSRIQEVYQLITLDIRNKGKQRRISTLFDKVIYFMSNLIKLIDGYNVSLNTQTEFMLEKRSELEKLLQQKIQIGNRKIERKCKDVFDKTRSWIPSFLDDYFGKESAQSEYRSRMDKEKKKIELEMQNLFIEIVDDLRAALAEFQKQYQYDMGTIKIEPPDFGSFQDLQVGNVLKWVGVGLGAAGAIAFTVGVFAAANFWNPVGWVATVASVVVGLFSWMVGNEEAKAWRKAKDEAKKTLYQGIEQSEKEVCKAYQELLRQNIGVTVKQGVLNQVDTYIEELSGIAKILNYSNLYLKNLNNDMEAEKQRTIN